MTTKRYYKVEGTLYSLAQVYYTDLKTWHKHDNDSDKSLDFWHRFVGQDGDIDYDANNNDIKEQDVRGEVEGVVLLDSELVEAYQEAEAKEEGEGWEFANELAIEIFNQLKPVMDIYPIQDIRGRIMGQDNVGLFVRFYKEDPKFNFGPTAGIDPNEIGGDFQITEAGEDYVMRRMGRIETEFGTVTGPVEMFWADGRVNPKAKAPEVEPEPEQEKESTMENLSKLNRKELAAMLEDIEATRAKIKELLGKEEKPKPRRFVFNGNLLGRFPRGRGQKSLVIREAVSKLDEIDGKRFLELSQAAGGGPFDKGVSVLLTEQEQDRLEDKAVTLQVPANEVIRAAVANALMLA